jgi:hypothetical protein
MCNYIRKRYELRNQELAQEEDSLENNHIHKFGHLYTKTFRPSLAGMPQGAGSRASILDSTTVGVNDEEEDEAFRKRKDEMDEELLKSRYGGSGSKSIHGVMNRRLKTPSQSRNFDSSNEDNINSSSGGHPFLDQRNESQSEPRSPSHIRDFGRKNTLTDDDRPDIDPVHAFVDDHNSTRSKRRAFQDQLSRDITLHLGIAVSMYVCMCEKAY